ncbi:MAG: hypothetical protein AABZ55_04920 [Bdellovibrionota bacterium]
MFRRNPSDLRTGLKFGRFGVRLFLDRRSKARPNVPEESTRGQMLWSIVVALSVLAAALTHAVASKNTRVTTAFDFPAQKRVPAMLDPLDPVAPGVAQPE